MKDDDIYFSEINDGSSDFGDQKNLPGVFFIFNIDVENAVQNIENFKFRHLIIRFSVYHGRINDFML